jgi:adenosine deaminase
MFRKPTTGPAAKRWIDMPDSRDTASTPWLERIPKVELHLHIEGAIPHAALWQLMERHGGDSRVPTVDDLPAQFVYRDFPDFIDRWVWKQGFLRDAADIETVGAGVAAELARQRIVYAEALFSPTDLPASGLPPQEVALALRRGIASVPDVEVWLIADVVRDTGPVKAARTLEALAEVAAEAGVIGIGLGGSEQLFPPEPFAPVYERARALGLRTSAHAGEVAGPASVRGAIDVLRADRIDHGTRAIDDPALVRLLAERRIPVTSCPGSNVATGSVATLAGHPIRRFFDAGVLVSIATDDPAMFGLSLAREYQALQTTFGFTDDEIRALVLTGIESAWLPDARKTKLRARFEGDPAWRG